MKVLAKATLTIVFCLTLTGCFKTAEEIEREKKIDQMLVQMVDTQTLMADMTIKTEELQKRLAQLRGEMEEVQHTSAQQQQQQIKKLQEDLEQMNAQVAQMQESLNNNGDNIKQLEVELSQHRKFIKSITKAIPQPENTKEVHVYFRALNAYKKRRYKEAKNLLLEALDSKINNAEKNKVYYRLGKIEMLNKDYQQAMIYFSKIYTNWPKSSLAPSSLYNIAKSLSKIGEKKKARASYKQLIKNYSSHKLAKKAQKALAKL
ncbi:MAG: tetratricopeptide repeat protein [Bacteriovoracia bacterium]